MTHVTYWRCMNAIANMLTQTCLFLKHYEAEIYRFSRFIRYWRIKQTAEWTRNHHTLLLIVLTLRIRILTQTFKDEIIKEGIQNNNPHFLPEAVLLGETRCVCWWSRWAWSPVSSELSAPTEHTHSAHTHTSHTYTLSMSENRTGSF